ncbi:MAG: WbuC family cupin fold metalloprotein [Gammaproteobacteria bacterium]
MLDELATKAAASPRLRAHHNVHDSAADSVQRFFVVATRDSYFRPHRHLTKIETALALRGRFDVVTFDDAGVVTGRYAVGEGAAGFGYETPEATWHTLVVSTPTAAFYEVKEGPYDPATALELAPWAPPEGDANARAYLDWARSAKLGTRR